MRNYIILFMAIITAIYKLLTRKKEVIEDKIQDPFDGPIQQKCKSLPVVDPELAHAAYKERQEIKTRVINDHIAEIMNIKKEK